MKKQVFRYFGFFLAVEFFSFQLLNLSWAKNAEIFDSHTLSVAVIAYPSSQKDRALIEETADAIRARLEKNLLFHVVSADQGASLVRYHADIVNFDSVLTGAERYLGLAKTHWFDRQYEEAEATVNSAINGFRKQKGKGDLLVDALLTKVVILQETKRVDESKAVFKEALSVDPSLSMEGIPLSGRSRRAFNTTRKEVAERLSGGLDIKTDPPAASIYLNGIKKGASPMTLSPIPEGRYLLTLEGSHYQTINEPVTITASTTQFIFRKLQWLGNHVMAKSEALGVPVKTDQAIQEEIKMATKIGETLKVDKVILVSSEKKVGKGDSPKGYSPKAYVTVRTIDTSLKAAYNPLGMSFSDLVKDKERSIATMADELDQQARINVLNNPEEFINPHTGDIKVLRRQRPFYKTPVFYTVTGLLICGAVGATTGILLTRGDDHSSSDEGGVTIEFR